MEMTDCEACEKSDMEHKNSMPPVLEVREYHHALIALRTKERDEALAALKAVAHDVEMFDYFFSIGEMVDTKMGAYHGTNIKVRLAEARRILAEAEGKEP